LWTVAVIAWVLLYNHPQPPGTAAIILAAWATAMTFRDMKAAQKLLGTLVIALFATLEFRSIHYDHIAQDVARSADQRELQDKFSLVLLQNQRSFDATKRHIETAISESENIFNNVSGGDSFVYVVPNKDDTRSCADVPNPPPACKTGLSLVAINGGDYPMRGISIDIALDDYIAPQPNTATKFIPTIRIPEIPAHGSEVLSGVIYPELKKIGTLSYVMRITGENGSVKETLSIRVFPRLEIAAKQEIIISSVECRYRVSRMETVKGQPNTQTERILVDSGWPSAP
jgi:hypothetical protein